MNFKKQNFDLITTDDAYIEKFNLIGRFLTRMLKEYKKLSMRLQLIAFKFN